MKMKRFDRLLDRFGPDFDAWPSGEAPAARRWLSQSAEARGSYDALRRLETAIRSSRPEIARARAGAVVDRALREIERRQAQPSLMEQLRRLALAPLPRVAFAMMLTAAGFGIGRAVGDPGAGQTGAPLVTASADDVLF